jgi:hypothetical protein
VLFETIPQWKLIQNHGLVFQINLGGARVNPAVDERCGHDFYIQKISLDRYKKEIWATFLPGPGFLDSEAQWPLNLPRKEVGGLFVRVVSQKIFMEHTHYDECDICVYLGFCVLLEWG